LICGDALEPETYARLLAGETAQLVFTDPPYNVRIDGHVSGLGAAKHREFAMASGEMSETEFTAFLSRVFANLAATSGDGAINYVCMDWRHMSEVLAAARGTYAELKNLCVWSKTNGGMGSLYRSQHELVFVFKVGTS
jgi:DNA modification methylase